MAQERRSGVLLHVTSLPSYGGIGDFGPAAYGFIDFLAAGKQRLWQVLPLNPTGHGGSPYSALSAFAGNALLISVEKLVEDGWLTGDRIAGLSGHAGPVDLDEVKRTKLPLLYEAAANFLDRADEDQRGHYLKFCQDNASWLTDFAMFVVLRHRFHHASWHEWPPEYALRKQEALTALMNEEARAIAVEQAIQYLFSEQWSALRSHCERRGVRIMGDVAIFVSYDSADVWTHPEVFDLDEQRRPMRVAGVPPDYFSKTGQRWGNPLYNWGALRERGFDWWVARIRRSLTHYDLIRLDHFRGFEAFWSIAAEEETAINGQWVKAPGYELFQRLKEVFGDLPFVAEDLGLITPEVDELRERFGMPGMRVLQFGFTDRGSHLYLPHRFVPNSVVYTGTHDNNTTLGWWREDTGDGERAHARTYLEPIEHDTQIVWAMIRAAARSVADLCIFPLQDVLHLGSEGRMNTPSNPSGNWTWRYLPDALHPDFAIQLAALTEMTDRDGYEELIEGPDAGKPVDEASRRTELGASV